MAQEAFVRIYERREGFNPSQDFSPWFYRMNLCLDHLRRDGRRGGHLRLVTEDDEARSLPASETGLPVDRVEREELSARVQSALRSLPDRQRMALVLQPTRG